MTGISGTSLVQGAWPLCKMNPGSLTTGFLLQEMTETVEDNAARLIVAEPCDHVKFERLYELKRRTLRSLQPHEPENHSGALSFSL